MLQPDPRTLEVLLLGACSPPLAHQALQAVPDINLLLPCNMITTQAT